jgi:hypothetical protein
MAWKRWRRISQFSHIPKHSDAVATTFVSRFVCVLSYNNNTTLVLRQPHNKPFLSLHMYYPSLQREGSQN